MERWQLTLALSLGDLAGFVEHCLRVHRLRSGVGGYNVTYSCGVLCCKRLR